MSALLLSRWVPNEILAVALSLAFLLAVTYAACWWSERGDQ